MITLQNLSRCFGDTTAVNSVSLNIPAGQICGYLGPNGAGKTTTVKMLTGMIKPTSGSASVAGFDILQQPMDVKRRIGYVPESGAVYNSLTPWEFLSLIGRLHDMKDSDIKEKVEEFSRFFHLSEHLNQRMVSFSKGMKQKVVIMASILHNPQVLFMDEPLTGLDANAALLLKKLIRHLADEGKTVFYCSHLLDVVENLCDRVVIINEGKIVADGSINELKEITKRSSLEGVFSQMTSSEDITEIARVFSRRITNSKAQKENS